MRRRWIIVALALIAFVAVTLVLGRWLTTENTERDRVTDLLQAQLAGDADAMLAQLDAACVHRPACVGTVRENAERLQGPGDLEIVAYDSGTGYSLGPGSAPTRVVWRAGDRLTTVQCVGVRREGNIVAGTSVSLTGLSAPIDREGAC